VLRGPPRGSLGGKQPLHERRLAARDRGGAGARREIELLQGPSAPRRPVAVPVADPGTSGSRLDLSVAPGSLPVGR